MVQAIVKTNAQLDPSILLGHLEFHHIPDLKIHKDDLTKLFQMYNLPLSYMPNEIRPHDAYRRATATAAQTLEITYDGKIKSAKLLVREVFCDNKRVMRHLVREVIDQAQEKPMYITVGRLKFDRNSNDMDVDWDANYIDEADYKGVVEAVKTLFTEWTQYHTKDTIRNIVTRMIKDTNPVSIMSRGKAVFIPKSAIDRLTDIKSMIESLHPWAIEPPAMDLLPMIDTIDQRQFVQNRLQSDVVHEANSLMADFADLLAKNGAVKLKTVQNYTTQVMDLRQKVEDYEVLLGATMTTLNQQLQAALTNIQIAPVEVDDVATV